MEASPLTPPPPADQTSALQRLEDLARAAGAASVADDAAALVERVREGRFYVACLGQFKRGKSSLLNALIGDPVLPTGVVPVTSVVTVIRYGRRPSARVRFASGEWQEVDPRSLASYVTEEQNPDNRLGVTGVEVFHPAELLASGMSLVDTPGLGSIFAAATAATRAFVPHVDTALVVLGGDPPIGGEELALVEQVAQEADRILPVLNKADRLGEVELEEARSFTRRTLEKELGRDVGEIPAVSATERLAGIGPARDWPTLLAKLDDLAHGAGAELVQSAEHRGRRSLISRLLHELEERRGALLRPIAESEARVAALRRTAAEAERSMADLGYLLNAEQDRLARALQDQRERFLADARPRARTELLASLADAPERGAALRRKALELSRAVYHHWLDRWRQELEPASEDLYRQAASRFVALAGDFLAKLATSGDAALTRLPREVTADIGLRAKSHVYYTDLMHVTGTWPGRWLVDRLMTPAAFRSVVEREAVAYLDRLLTTNASRVAYDLDERIRESRRRLEGEIRHLLEDIYGAAERALEAARARLSAGGAAAEDEIHRIDQLEQELMSLREES